ncbi:MAG: hypothetical protein U0X93_01935 [Anaerolineales bacterium]
MTDQNQALPSQGSEHNPQGESKDNNNQTMESLLNEQELSVDLPQAGEIRKGTIASVSPSQILVSIGAKSEGSLLAANSINSPRMRSPSCKWGRKCMCLSSTPKTRTATLSSR